MDNPEYLQYVGLFPRTIWEHRCGTLKEIQCFGFSICGDKCYPIVEGDDPAYRYRPCPSGMRHIPQIKMPADNPFGEWFYWKYQDAVVAAVAYHEGRIKDHAAWVERYRDNKGEKVSG